MILLRYWQFAMMVTMLCNIFCAGSSTTDVNEATLVRNNIDPFFRMYLKNSPLYEAVGARAVYQYAS